MHTCLLSVKANSVFVEFSCVKLICILKQLMFKHYIFRSILKSSDDSAPPPHHTTCSATAVTSQCLQSILAPLPTRQIPVRLSNARKDNSDLDSSGVHI